MENNKKVVLYNLILCLVILLQVITAFYFGTQKQGYHYDENYSYYSSNVTAGLVPSDNEWKDSSEILKEFEVVRGEAYNYKGVKLMQTYDVHPPMYYYVLHTVCSITTGIYSKWQGIAVNIVFFLFSIIMLTAICNQVRPNDRLFQFFTVALFGFSPAVISGVTFIRMYMMLTFLCFLALFIHLRVINGAKRTAPAFYIPVFVVTFIGFMTHYYFVVFMFFLAAFMSLFLFVKRETRKSAFVYAACVLAGMAAGVLYYPACLGHIFRGYRGTEAIGSFFDMGNLQDRAGLFVGIVDEYLLCRTFYISLLIVIMMYATFRTVRRRWNILNGSAFCILTVTAGYFVVVLKTALMNAEEAVRYELPVYGLIILLIVYMLVVLAEEILNKQTENRTGFRGIVMGLMLTAALVMQIMGLAGGKVLFLYTGEEANINWAKEHTDDCVVYIYNPNNAWMIWTDAEELMNYKKVFYISADNEDKLTDAEVLGASKVYAMAMRGDKSEGKLEELKADRGVGEQIIKIRELSYADVYELR